MDLALSAIELVGPLATLGAAHTACLVSRVRTPNTSMVRPVAVGSLAPFLVSSVLFHERLLNAMLDRSTLKRGRKRSTRLSAQSSCGGLIAMANECWPAVAAAMMRQAPG